MWQRIKRMEQELFWQCRNRNCFGNVRTELSRKRKELKEAEKVAMRSGNNHQVRDLQKEIAELVDKENRL